MCGIVGCITKASNGYIKKTEDSFFQMLFADTLRGEDSTGVIAVENDTTWHIAKEAVPAPYFIDDFKSSSIGRDMWMRGKAFIGHNRKKTQGKISDENAHPFTVGDHFALVHNGTLHGHKLLAEKDVDSEALAVVLQKAFEADDYVKKVEETLKTVWGAYAIAIYDQKRHMVHLVRNKERPLHYVEAPDAFYFASEAMMMGWVLSRNDYKIQELKFEDLPVDTLLSYDLEKNSFVMETLDVKKATPTATPPWTSGYMGHGGTHSTSNTGTLGTLTTTKGKTTEKEEVSKNRFKSFRKTWIGKMVRFWVEDYVEADVRQTLAQGAQDIIIFGQNDEWKVIHSITADVDLSPLKINKEEEIVNREWIGHVENMTYSSENRSIVVEMGRCKPIASSVNLIKLEKELKEMSIPSVYGKYRYELQLGKLSKAEINVYLKVINEGEEFVAKQTPSIKSYKAIIDRCRLEGRELTHSILNAGDNTVRLTDEHGEILYEGPITLH